MATYDDSLVAEAKQDVVGEVLDPPHPNQQFLDYIKEAEGWHGTGIDSQEGGSQTVGWGHKLVGDEDFSNASMEDLHDLFMNDYKKTVVQGRASIDNKYGEGSFDNLPKDRQNMLLDFIYNTGQVPHMLEKDYSGRFTQFGDAIMTGDNAALLAKDDTGEWIGQRYFTDTEGNRRLLTRNRQFKEHFGLE